VGTLVPSASVTVALVGNDATGVIGGLASAVSVLLDGEGATGAVGTTVPSASVTAALSGNAATGLAGNLSASIDVPLAGEASTGAVGGLAPIVGQVAEFVRFIFDRAGRPGISKLNDVALNAPGIPEFVLIHDWTMDEVSGNRVDSIAGYVLSNQGFFPIGSEPGQLGNASLYVATENSWLQGLAADDILPSGGPFVFSAWVKPGGTNGATQTPLAVGAGGLTRRFSINLPNGRTSIVMFVADAAGNASTITAFLTVTAGQYHLLAVRRSSANVWSLSVWDGTAWVEGDSTPTVILNPADEPFAVGALPTGGNPINGSIDSIRVWAGIVSNADLLALQSGLAAGPSSALALFKFNGQGQPRISRLTNIAIFTTGQED